MTRTKTLIQNTTRLGVLAGLKWTAAVSANSRALVHNDTSIRPSWMSHPLFVRMGKSSDVDVFRNIFVSGELDFWRSVKDVSPKVILDLGANVGYASAFFLNAFPQAFVLAVEPDPKNAEMCRRNLEPYGARAKVVEGAVWHTAGNLVLSRGSFADGREWATQVRIAKADEAADVVAWDIPALLEMCPGSQIDLLKIDIEGSERALFSSNVSPWLPRVRNICIEIHGPECAAAVSNALALYSHQQGQTGEYRLYLNIALRSAEQTS